MRFIKVLVTGNFYAERTTFIQCLSEIDYCWVETSSGVAAAFGRITAHESTALYFFGTPDSRRIQDMDIQKLMEGADACGVVFLLNAADRTMLAQSHFILNTVREMDLPYVIAITHLNQSDALSEQVIKNQLDIQAGEVTLTCNTLDPDHARAILLALLNHMPQNTTTQQMIAKIASL